MRWITTLLTLMFCLGAVSAQGTVGDMNFAKPSYKNLTGLCKLTNQRELMLIKGYLVFKEGFVFGRMERLDDFLFVIHQNLSSQVGDDSVYTSIPLLFFTKHTGGERSSFIRSTDGTKVLDCDFSADPYGSLSK
jgi:hypothetical protein